jgi:hypothetical protein
MEGIELQNNPDDFNYEWENDSIYKDTDASEREENSMRVDSINLEELIKIKRDSLNN